MIKALTFILSFLFFVISLLTLSHYGVNWDSVSHLQRGQAYLHYYITGKKDYTDLTQWDLRNKKYFQQVDTIFFKPNLPKDEVPRISIYQNTGQDLNNIMLRYDYGHPHVSDVSSSFFNLILFQKLGLLNDIDSYRVYGVLLASFLVGLVFWWTTKSYGKFAGLIAAITLSLYPLFWSESHFNNEKDIPETVFITFMLFSFYQGIIYKSWRWILAFGVFFGLALGTKFNVLFSIFIILPWFIIYLMKEKITNKYFSIKFSLALIAAPIIGIFIVIGTWPFFWSDPIQKTLKIISFYKTIGTTVSIEQGFTGPFGISTYPIQWILYTTPLVILFLSMLGLIQIIKNIKKKDMQSLLILLMFLVPILRVTWPGMNIYGGVRQIMEYIPAMAMIAGIGGLSLRNKIESILSKRVNKFQLFASIMILILFVPHINKLIEIHPNENVYFNPLIGGLKGAKERDFPGWGVSFGAPYREAIDWINKNTEQGAKLTTGYEILSNIPGIFIRPDIVYKSNRSGYLREGEYVISLRFQGAEKRSYFDMYLDRMIEPVHQVTVDGVPILKIWKNDKEHLKKEWSAEEVLDNVDFTKNNNGLSFDAGKVVKLSRLEIWYSENDCMELTTGYLMVSKNGEEWERIPGVLPEEVRIKVLGTQPSNGKFIEPFAGQIARYINLYLSPQDSCVTQIEKVKLYYFK